MSTIFVDRYVHMGKQYKNIPKLVEVRVVETKREQGYFYLITNKGTFSKPVGAPTGPQGWRKVDGKIIPR